MKLKKVMHMLSLSLITASIFLTGCAGLIKPTIGETSQLESQEQSEAGPGEGNGGDNFGDMEMMFGGQQESQPRPEMAGNLVESFFVSTTIEDARGGISELIAMVECYDANNTDGNNALLSIAKDGAFSFDEGTWSEENGVYSFAIDEFTVYETINISGVQTFTGIRFSAGMSSGTIDIPKADIPEDIKNAALNSGLETEGGN